MLLYYSYSKNLTETEIAEIDEKVSRNRKLTYQFMTKLSSTTKRQTKKVFIIVGLGIILVFSNVDSTQAIGLLSFPPTSLVKIEANAQNEYSAKVVPTVIPKLDKISFGDYTQLPSYIYMMDQKFLKTSEVNKLLNKISRGGGTVEMVTVLIAMVFLWQIMGVGIDSFILPSGGWGVDGPNKNKFQPPGGQLKYPPTGNLFSPYTTPSYSGQGSTLTVDVIRPSSVPHQEFTGLTKAQQRALPHPNDMKIIHEGRPELNVGFWQVHYKVSDHGAVHGLPYTLKSNGRTKTEKTEQHTLEMMQSIVDMPKRDNVRWIGGTYQGGTDREFEAIHIYDVNEKVIAVFKKSTGKFVTTCQLTLAEEIELRTTGNFGGIKERRSGQTKNLPPQETTINTFEKDVMGITPISPIDENPMDENSSPGFTPKNSFESDIMDITPRDNS